MPEGQYYKKLIEFLNNNRAKRGEKTSHFSMGTPVGSYYLSGAKRDRLNRLVARALNEGAVLSIVAKVPFYLILTLNTKIVTKIEFIQKRTSKKLSRYITNILRNI